eukprot:366112-Chlamydomonas_euryale.AAC.19
MSRGTRHQFCGSKAYGQLTMTRQSVRASERAHAFCEVAHEGRVKEGVGPALHGALQQKRRMPLSVHQLQLAGNTQRAQCVVQLAAALVRG